MPDTPASEPLTNVDTAWLRMDDPDNLMVISVLLLLSGPLSAETLHHHLLHTWLTIPRMQQRVEFPRLPGSPPRWTNHEHLDPKQHFSEHPLPDDTQESIEALCGQLISQPLDHALPLWHLHLLQSPTRSALLFRAHHCIGDGRTMLYLLNRLAPAQPSLPEPATYTPLPPSTQPSVLRQIATNTAAFFRTLRPTGRRYGTFDTVRMVRQPDDNPTPLKGPIATPKRTTWTPRPLPLPDIKALGKAHGCTINDVITAAIAGSLRNLLHHMGCDPAPSIRAAVPVDLKTPEEHDNFGNKFGVVLLELPTDLDTPAARLATVHERMSSRKASAEADGTLGLLNTLGVLPRKVQQRILGTFATKASLVSTNVAGPRHPIYIADQQLEGIFVWVPQAGRLALGISLISYNNQIWMGFASDANRIPNPHLLVDGVYAEIEKLRALSPST